jgi:hypothetical protein
MLTYLALCASLTYLSQMCRQWSFLETKHLAQQSMEPLLSLYMGIPS